MVREGVALRHSLLVTPPHAYDEHGYRWTLDTPKDLEFFRAVAQELDTTTPRPDIPTLLALMEARPDIANINR